ncbi:MAG: endonuclease V [Caldilineaceae bacterium]
MCPVFLLSFREAPARLRALEQLSAMPDLIPCDLRVVLDLRWLGWLPLGGLARLARCAGVAKSLLDGSREPGPTSGKQALLRSVQETIAPLYVVAMG